MIENFYLCVNKARKPVKYKEFHRKIIQGGWRFHHTEGSLYFCERGGILSQPVPYYGSKEIPQPLRKKMA